MEIVKNKLASVPQRNVQNVAIHSVLHIYSIISTLLIQCRAVGTSSTRAFTRIAKR